MNNYIANIVFNETVSYDPTSLVDLNIRSWADEILPRFDMVYMDNNFITEQFPVFEGMSVKFYLAYDEEQDNIVELEFEVDSVEFTGGPQSTQKAVMISGYMNIPATREVRSGSIEGTSGDALSSIFDLDIIIDSNDNQKWVRFNETGLSFYNRVIHYSWKEDDDAMFCYYSFPDQKFNYNSFKNASKQEPGLLIYSEEYVNPISDESQQRKDVSGSDRIILTYQKIDLKNLGGYVNNFLGNGGKMLNIFSGTDNEEIDLTFDTPVLGEVTNISEKYSDVVSNTYIGRQRIDIHDKYIAAPHIRKNTIASMLKQSIVVTIKPDNRLRIMDKFEVKYPSVSNDNGDNDYVSGYYVIFGIVTNVSSNILTQTLCLVRDGINIPINENDDYIIKVKG